MGRKWGGNLWIRSLRTTLVYLLAGGAALIFGLPLLWVLAFSLRAPGLPPPVAVEWLPRPLVWGNYARIFELAPLGRYLGNSLLLCALAVPLTLLTASWAGFAMAQLEERVRRRLILLAVLLLMVPAAALLLPRFLLFSRLGLLDTYWPLLAPAGMGASPFFALLFCWTFLRLPRELFEAARLDGASPLRIWRSVAMPLAGPTSACVAVLAWALFWGDFTGPLLYLKTDSRYTLPVGVQLLQQLDRTNWPLLMAAAVLLTAPVVALFLAVQRYFWPEGRARQA